MRISSLPVIAAAFCIATASRATAYDIIFSAETGAFKPYNTNPTVEAALPIGTVVSGQIRFETTAISNVVVPATGQVSIGTLSYSALDTSTSLGALIGSQAFSVYDFRLDGPLVPPFDSDSQSGRLYLHIGIADPDALAALPSSYPYPSVFVSFPGAGGFGGANFYAPLAFSSVRISAAPVPESATWITTIIGFGAVGASLRRRQRLALRYS